MKKEQPEQKQSQIRLKTQQHQCVFACRCKVCTAMMRAPGAKYITRISSRAWRHSTGPGSYLGLELYRPREQNKTTHPPSCRKRNHPNLLSFCGRYVVLVRAMTALDHYLQVASGHQSQNEPPSVPQPILVWNQVPDAAGFCIFGNSNVLMSACLHPPCQSSNPLVLVTQS